MSLEAHATAAGAGHPRAAPEPSPGTLVNLAETIVIKEENVFVVCRRDGSLPIAEPHPLGVYSDDCRFLSGHELLVNGVEPRLLVASAAPGSESVHELTNPALPLPGGRVLPLQSLQLRFERRLAGECELEETLLVHSYDREPLELRLDLVVAADFEPMLAIRGIVAAGRGAGVAVERRERGLRLAARGRDGRHRATTIDADRECERGDTDASLRFRLALPPGGAETITLRYALHEGDDPAEPAATTQRPRPARRAADAWLQERTRVVTDDELFNRVLRRSLLDMRMLHSRIRGEGFYAAGVPWYATLFGRDSLIAATQMLAFDPPMAEQTLRVLAGLIGTRDDPAHDEEPGKVLHELRAGEVARLGLTPLARYYGTVDATPLFLCLLCEHADWSGDLALFHELRGAVDAMLGWIDGPGDRDGDGLLEYMQRAGGAGLRNQGWKDSDEGVLDEHGRPLEPPVALIEPQAYALRAKRRLARLFSLAGDEPRAQALLHDAIRLRERLERFWLPERRYYSMGFGGDGRLSEALASNQGHLLWATALPQERAQAVRDSLMSGAMFSGWGIRTLAQGEAGYNPVGYHLGTVWPHDTAMIAFGLRKYGFDDDFALLFEALLEAASNSEAYRLPELFAGFSRTEFETPVPYPVACQPQAWAAGAIPYLVTGGLGLVPDALGRRLRVRRPSLPRWLNRVEVSGLRVAGSRVDLLFERAGAGEQVALTDARIDGDVEVVLEISGSRVPSGGRY
jgi:glycogen debranching enzyme